MKNTIESRGLLLPAPGLAPYTDAGDPVPYYYRPLTAGLYRGRLRLAKRLLGEEKVGAILEIGYGSGIFFPELAKRCDRLVGIDIHPEESSVRTMLGELDLEAELHTASLFALPFEPGTFDAVVCLSVLEHLTELDEAMAALRAQLKPGGVAILGFPVRNPVTDLFFRAAGYKPREVHPSSHADIIGAARRHPGFTVDKVARMPWFLPLPFAAYVACRCVAR